MKHTLTDKAEETLLEVGIVCDNAGGVTIWSE